MIDGAGPTCAACGQVNAAGQKFCGNCGAPMPVACPSCATINPAGQKFCGECGTPLGASVASPPVTAAPPPPVIVAPVPAVPVSVPEEPAPIQEERRLITAIFCDLEGFTPLTESLDPEEVREIQTAYFAAMNAELHRFGGSVEKYAGDAVLALFGAPVAHEDDAERAVRCALSMQRAFQSVAEMARREWGAKLAVRIGVNTGEAISGAWDVEGKRDYSATGDVVNTAARLQTACEPGGVIVGPETMHLARRAIIFGPREDLTLKGKAEPFPAYRVLGLREQIAERWETREQRAPLVGRERELAQVLAAFERVESGDGRIVTLVAEAGVGKSRLVAEAVAVMGGVAGTVVVRGRCLSFGQGMSLHLVADLVRNLCQLREGDEPDKVRSHLSTTVDSLLAPYDSATREVARDVLGTLLGLPSSPSAVTNADPQVRRQSLIQSLTLLLSTLSTFRPAILLLEDLHWSDDASAEVMAEVLTVVHDRKALVLATHRPDWTAPWAGSPLNQTIALQPLGEGDAVGLARAIVGGMELEPELEQQVTDRAGGNPFFVEELLRSMQETGALKEREGRLGLAPGVAETLPSTLTELLLARLDQLDRSARTAAQHASVIGRTFVVPVLAGIAEGLQGQLHDALRMLERADIALPRHQAEGEYVFRHATVREVAYNALLVRRRQALHAACARMTMALYPVEEHVDVIAYHFSHSREHAEAAEWLERAADRAARVFANGAAIEQYDQARERLGMIDAPAAVLARIDEKQGRILRIVSRYDEALQVLERAAASYRAASDREGERRAVAEIGRVHRARGTPEEGIERVQALLAAPSNEASGGVAALHVVLARLYFNLGRYREQVESASQGSELAGRLGDRRVLAEAEMSRSIGLFLLGHTEEALAAMLAAAPIAEEVGDFEVLNNLLGNIALLYSDMGEFERSREYRERSAEVTLRLGDMANHSFALASLGELMYFLGDWSEAEGYLDRALTLVRSLPTSWFSFLPPTLLGRLYAARGELEEATDYLERALASAEHGNHRHAVRRIVDYLAEIDLMRGDPAAALSRFDGVVDLGALDEADSSLTETLPVAAWARLESGDPAEATRLASLGIKRAVEERAVVELVAAQRVSGMALAAQGALEEALRAFDQAEALAREIKHPYALARVLYERGLVLQRLGDHQEAISMLREALLLFQRLGARRYAQLAENALAVLAS